MTSISQANRVAKNKKKKIQKKNKTKKRRAIHIFCFQRRKTLNKQTERPVWLSLQRQRARRDAENSCKVQKQRRKSAQRTSDKLSLQLQERMDMAG